MTLRPSSLAKREAILAAAERAFLDEGFDAATMDAIAAEAGVSKQTAYAHFGSKQALFVELVTAMTRGAGDGIHESSPRIASADEIAPALEERLAEQLAVVLTPRLLRLRRLVIGEVARFPELARALAQHGPQRAIASFADILADLDDRGLLSVPDAEAAARQLNWLVMAEPVNAGMLLGDDAVPDARAQRAHVRAAIATFLAAYAR